MRLTASGALERPGWAPLDPTAIGVDHSGSRIALAPLAFAADLLELVCGEANVRQLEPDSRLVEAR